MPFEKGNQLGAKPRLFDEALRRAIAQDDGKRIRASAEKLLDAAAAGEQWAIGMLADRTDGKPHQSVSNDMKVKRESDMTDEELAQLARADQ